MSTIYKDKNGKVIRTEPDTQYHADGPGPRDKDGNLVINGDPVIPEEKKPANDADKAGAK